MVDSRRTNASGTQQFEEALDALRTTLADEPAPNRWHRDITLIGLLAAIFGVVAWYVLLAERPQPLAVEIQVASSSEGELAWIRPGFEQALIAYAHAGNRVRLNRPLGEAGAQSTNPILDVTTASRAPQAILHIELETDSASGVLRTKVQLVEGDKAHHATLTGYTSALADLASRTSMQVFSWLNLDPYTSAEQESARVEYPNDPQAGRHYALGLQALRRGEGKVATTELGRAQHIIPNHPMINTALAEAFDFLGYRSQALQYIRVAYDQRGSLVREKQLAIEARLRLLEYDWLEAEALYAALAAFYPQNISYRLALAEAQHLGSRSAEALETIQRMRSLSADPRIDLLEAQIWWRIGEWRKGVAAAERAAESARNLGHHGILARALLSQADMDGDPTGSGLNLASDIFEEMGDLYGQSQVLREHGDRHTAAGRLADAIAAYDASIEISNSLGNDAERDAARQAKAIAYDLNGELEAGYSAKLSLLESSIARGQLTRAAILMENLGISLLKLGRMEASLEWFDKAHVEFLEHSDGIGVAWHPYQRGRVLARMGNLQQARTLLQQALLHSEEHPEGYLELHTTYELLRLDLFEGKAGTGARLADLAKSYDESGLHLDWADTLLVLARHASMTGNPERAMANALQARQIFAESDAHYYLTRAETQRLRLGDREACGPLDELARSSEHREVVLMAIAALQSCGNRQDDLTSLLAEAKRLKLFEPQLALTARLDVHTAKELANQRGWLADDLWVTH